MAHDTDRSVPLPPTSPNDASVAAEIAASTRRQFLATSSVFVGAAAALAGCQTGANSNAAWLRAPKQGKRAANVAAGEPIKIGVIGVGGMGGEHVKRLTAFSGEKRENLQVLALADVCKPHLEPWVAHAKKAQNIQVDGYRNYHELLARSDLHGVLIAVPEHMHAPVSLAAIAAGKDVYCEKPFTMDLAEAHVVRAAAEASDLIFQVGTQYMMYPKYKEARKLVQAGTIGHPTFSQTSYCRNSKEGEWLYAIDPKVQPGELLDWDGWLGPLGPRAFDTNVFHRWRRYRDFSGGIVADLLVHMMTPLMYAIDAGWPVRVSAAGGHYVQKDMENHDQVFLTVEFEKEHTMVVAGSTCNELGLETIVRGHKANLFLGGNDCEMRPERVFENDVDAKKIACPQLEEPQDDLRLDWLRCIRTREKNQSTVEFATRMMVIVDLATRSLWDGHAYTYDPKTRDVRRA